MFVSVYKCPSKDAKSQIIGAVAGAVASWLMVKILAKADEALSSK